MSSYLVIVIPVLMADFIVKITGAARVLLFAALVATIGALIAADADSLFLDGLCWSEWWFCAAGGVRHSWNFKRRLRNQGLIVLLILVVWVACWPKSERRAHTALPL